MYTHHLAMQPSFPSPTATVNTATRRAPTAKLQWGAVQGRLSLPQEVLDRAKEHAEAYYLRMEKVDFSEDDVDVASAPRWLPAIGTWFPTEALAALGFERVPGGTLELVATVGVDPHVDNFHGPCFGLVLSNDRLKFRQGRQSHQTLPGEWFLFDDRLQHSVMSSSQMATTYLCVTVGVSAIPAAPRKAQ